MAAPPLSATCSVKVLPFCRPASSLSSSSLPFLSLSPSILASHSFVFVPSRHRWSPMVLAVAEEKEQKSGAEEEEEEGNEKGGSGDWEPRPRICELYVCNLPRSCDIEQLLELFRPFGTVVAVEVSRDAETGLSRGSGFVTLNSIQEAKAAIAALDGSELGGRELRVQFSANVASGRRNPGVLNTAPKKDIVFESPYKAYIGNLAWSVKPADLREHFSQFGTVVSARVLYDRKGGKNRVYGFLSFSSADELKSAIETSGSELRGRKILVREVVNRE